jgi:hypothetical protein
MAPITWPLDFLYLMCYMLHIRKEEAAAAEINVYS